MVVVFEISYVKYLPIWPLNSIITLWTTFNRSMTRLRSTSWTIPLYILLQNSNSFKDILKKQLYILLINNVRNQPILLCIKWKVSRFVFNNCSKKIWSFPTYVKKYFLWADDLTASWGRLRKWKKVHIV